VAHEIYKPSTRVEKEAVLDTPPEEESAAVAGVNLVIDVNII
jgi:hypothetical protein